MNANAFFGFFYGCLLCIPAWWFGADRGTTAGIAAANAEAVRAKVAWWEFSKETGEKKLVYCDPPPPAAPMPTAKAARPTGWGVIYQSDDKRRE